MKNRLNQFVFCLAGVILAATGLVLLGGLMEVPPNQTAQDQQPASFLEHKNSAASPEATLTKPRQHENVSASPLLEMTIGKHGRPIILPISLPNHRAVPFLLDTGASVSVLDESLKPQGVRPISQSRFSTPAGIIKLDLFPCPNAKLGDLDMSVIPAVAYANLAPMHAAIGRDIKGVLGIDFIARYPIEIDFDRGILRIWKSAPAEWDRDKPLTLVREQATPHIQCVLPGNRQEWFSLDTGANVSTIREQAFDVLVQEGEAMPFGLGLAATGGGRIRTPKAVLSSLTLADWQHTNLRVDRDLKSAIGLSYLSRYQVRLDLPRNRAFFRPGARFNVPDATATSGLALSQVNGHKVVQSVEPSGAAQKAGILPGDVIVTINGKPMANADMFEIGQLLTSQPGVTLQIGVIRQERRFDFGLVPIPRVATVQ